MTGQCYFCTKQEHHECSDTQCTCCGKRVTDYEAKVDRIYNALLKQQETWARTVCNNTLNCAGRRA